MYCYSSCWLLFPAFRICRGSRGPALGMWHGNAGVSSLDDALRCSDLFLVGLKHVFADDHMTLD